MFKHVERGYLLVVIKLSNYINLQNYITRKTELIISNAYTYIELFNF